MSRFSGNKQTLNKTNQMNLNKNHPFTNIYGCVEDDMIYINMEAVEGLSKNMVSTKDVALIIDISGSMRDYYSDGNLHQNKKSETKKGFFASLFGNSTINSTIDVDRIDGCSVSRLVQFLVDTMIQYDDDGIDLLFFSKGLIHKETVSSANEVNEAVRHATKKHGAFCMTEPTDAFKNFCKQLKDKKRDGIVLFLTDGHMSDNGSHLKDFYMNYLHTEFKTRDHFYCYAIEFGNSASGALDVLDGLFQPEQGPEDLFDAEQSNNLEEISLMLNQVASMSAIGSNQIVKAEILTDGVLFDMVNTDLIERKTNLIEGPINKVMSFRVRTKKPFTMKLTIKDFEPMTLKITPNGFLTEIDIL